MPEVTIRIGGRSFDVSCRVGEESFLETAAQMLDTEAHALGDQMGKIAESRMLLMAGLLLADKTAGLEDQVRQMQRRAMEAEQQVEQLRARAGTAVSAPSVETRIERLEVPVLPEGLAARLADMAGVAEGLAERAEGLSTRRG